MQNPWDIEYQRDNNKWKKETSSLPLVLTDKRVLELGCGNGKTISAIVRQKPSSLTAVDFSGKAIALSKERFKDESISFFNADVTELPFKDEEFDVVVCYYLLNALLEKDRKLAVSEIARVLNKKGLVLLEDFSVGDFRQEKADLRPEKNTIQKNSGITCHFFAVEELKILFNQFSSIKIKKVLSTPIKSNLQLKRLIIKGTISK